MAANVNLKTITNNQFMVGFGDLQISQVLDNLGHIFEMADVYRTVEIWHKRLAQDIIRVIGKNLSQHKYQQNDVYDTNDDEDLLDEWNDIILD